MDSSAVGITWLAHAEAIPFSALRGGDATLPSYLREDLLILQLLTIIEYDYIRIGIDKNKKMAIMTVELAAA